MAEHLTAAGKFKSDKYKWCEEGFLALKFTDRLAQPLIFAYATMRRAEDPEFYADVVEALKTEGWVDHHESEKEYLRQQAGNAQTA